MNNPILMIDLDGMAADSAGKPKPLPPPIQLKEVVIKAAPVKKGNNAGLAFGLATSLNHIPKWLLTADAVSQEIPVVNVILDIATIYELTKDVKFSKIGTPRKKSSKQLKKEWKTATGKKWTKEPGDPSKDQVVSHINLLGTN